MAVVSDSAAAAWTRFDDAGGLSLGADGPAAVDAAVAAAAAAVAGVVEWPDAEESPGAGSAAVAPASSAGAHEVDRAYLARLGACADQGCCCRCYCCC